jgi:hypothetical protein
VNRKWLIALVVASLAATLFVVYFDRPPALPPVMILPPGPLAAKSGRVPDRWIPPNWTWLQKACRFFRASPREISFNVKYGESSETVNSIVAQNSLGRPQVETNGFAVWILPDRPVKRTLTYSTIQVGRLINAYRGQESTAIASATGQCRVDLIACPEENTVDLSTRVVLVSESQTNLVAAVRAPLPWDHALFILDVRQPESATNRHAFWIECDEVDARGNRIHP